MVAFARNCSNKLSAIGIPQMCAGPSNGTADLHDRLHANEGSSPSSDACGSHKASSASAARCSNGAQGHPLTLITFIALESAPSIVASNLAPMSSGNWPRQHRPHLHIRSSRVANRARESSAVGFLALRAEPLQFHRVSVRPPPRPLPIRSPVGHLHHGAQLLVGEAALHRDLADCRQRLELRAVSTLSRTVWADSPCGPDRAVDLTPLIEHPQHRQLASAQVPLRGRPTARARRRTHSVESGVAARRPVRRTCTDPQDHGAECDSYRRSCAGRRSELTTARAPRASTATRSSSSTRATSASCSRAAATRARPARPTTSRPPTTRRSSRTPARSSARD